MGEKYFRFAIETRDEIDKEIQTDEYINIII